MTTPLIVSKEIVQQVFQARIDGKKIDEISENFPFSSWTVREILKRNKGGEFTLTAEMNEYVLPQLSTQGKKKIASKRSIIDAVMELVEAKRDFQRAIRNALEGGLTKFEVNRIIDPIMEKEKEK